MSAVLEPKLSSVGAAPADMSSKLAFSKKLQAVTNRIHSTTNVDEIMLDVARDICQLFDADRLTIYTMSELTGDARAQQLAEKENLSDVIAGVEGQIGRAHV